MNEQTTHTGALFDQLRALALPHGSFVIFGSGPMAVRGLKDARDLDVVVTKEVFDAFRGKEGWTERSNGTDTCLTKDDLELWRTWGPGEWHVEELLASAEVIDDLPFAPLPLVLRWKEAMGRPKDREDIETIRTYLGLS